MAVLECRQWFQKEISVKKKKNSVILIFDMSEYQGGIVSEDCILLK